MKKVKIFDCIFSFVLCFFIHNLYNNFPCFFTSIFSPVNESIIEHMKLFITSLTIISLFDYTIFKHKKINLNNIFLNLFLSISLCIIFYLIIFIPIYNEIGENFIFSIILLFITLILSQILSYFIYNFKNFKYLNYISLLLVILIYIVFTYFSYNPIFDYLFFDIVDNKYGINIYID